MNRLITWLKHINTTWKDLPRRGIMAVATLFILIILVKIMPYVLPFLFALVVAFIIKPLANVCECNLKKICKHKFPSRLMTLTFVFILYALILGAIFWIGTKVVSEVGSFIIQLPELARESSIKFKAWIDAISEYTVGIMGDEFLKYISVTVSRAIEEIAAVASGAAKQLAVSTWSIATTLPQKILFVVFMIASTYYIVADRVKIRCFFNRWTPDPVVRWISIMKSTAFKGILGQIKSALVIMILTSIELSIGLSILGVRYSIGLGILIGVMDALPIIGAGLFLIPMSIWGFLMGNISYGIGVAIMYGIVIVFRQIIEPRIVGYQLGLHPLESMISMYAGLVAMGFTGMILGPILLLFIKTMMISESNRYNLMYEPEKARDVNIDINTTEKEEKDK